MYYKFLQVLKINNLINQFSDRSRTLFYSAFILAEKLKKDVTPPNILYVKLEDSDKYLKDILINITNKIDFLKNDIFLLLNQSKKMTNLRNASRSNKKFFRQVLGFHNLNA